MRKDLTARIRRARELTARLLRSRALIAAVLAFIILLGLHRWASTPHEPPDPPADSRALLYGLSVNHNSFVMPLSSTWTGLLHRASPAARGAVGGLVASASLLLIFGLGCLLHSTACGLLACAAAVYFGWMTEFVGQEDSLYIFTLLLTANALAWRERVPDRWKSVVAGIAIAISLLVRSSLFLLPAVLSIYEWFARPKKQRRKRLVSLLPLWGVPCLLLLPWIYMNWSIHGRFIPFEDGRANYNIVAGALGLVPTVDGAGLFELAGIEEGQSVYRWAVSEILRHPLRYALAYCGRIWYAASLHPIIFILGLLSLGLYRKRKEHALVTLFVCYFFAVHCIMAVEKTYFNQIFPTMLVLASSLLVYPFKEDKNRTGLGFAVIWGGVCLFPLFCLSLYSLYLSGTYPHRKDTSEQPLERALAKHPDVSMLWTERGRRRMRRGEAPLAASDFAKAMTIDPDEDRLIEYAWALMARGGPAEDLIDRIQRGSYTEPWKLYLLKTIGHLRHNREREAAVSFALAQNSGLSGCRVTRLKTERELQFQKDLCSASGVPPSTLLGFVEPWPLAERLSLLQRMERLPGMEGRLGNEIAEAAMKANIPELARSALKRSESARLSPHEKLRVAQVWAELGKHDRASEIVKALLEGSSRRHAARLWLKAASVALRAGDAEKARECLQRADVGGPSTKDMRWAAKLHNAAGGHRRALTILEGLIKRSPDSPALHLELASAARGAGARERSLRALEHASALDPTPAEQRMIALEFQQLKEYGRAIRILIPLTKHPPLRTLALMDKGICEHLNGSPGRAIEDFNAAIRLDPKPLSAYLSLGTVFISQNRPADALRVFERALAIRSQNEDLGIRRMILESRDKLVSAKK